jgi:C4-dicarboxylate transporter DctM subunit
MLWFIVALMVAALILGVPIYLGIFLGVVLIALYEMNIDPIIITAIMFGKVNMFVLLAVPLFLMAGYFVAYGGTAKALLGLLNAFMQHIPGGPAYAVIVGCVIFAAMSSSSMAAVAGFSPIMIPMMIEMGYDKKFSIGLLVCGATLGQLIPPSILLIIYGVIAEESIRDLYLGAFMPGFAIAFLLFVTVLIMSKRGSYQTKPAASWSERLHALRYGWWVVIMPPVVLVPIYAGWVTPTEAAAVCAAYSFFLGVVIYRGLKIPQILESIRTVVRMCSMIFLIIMAAFLLNWTLVYMRVPFNIAEDIVGLGLSAPVFLLVIILMYLVMGMVLDALAIMLVGAIMLLPTIIELGINPIVFGILIVYAVGVACITPPYGILLFMTVGVLREPFHVVARGCFYFFPAMIIGLFLIAYVEPLTTFLIDIV